MKKMLTSVKKRMGYGNPTKHPIEFLKTGSAPSSNQTGVSYYLNRRSNRFLKSGGVSKRTMRRRRKATKKRDRSMKLIRTIGKKRNSIKKENVLTEQINERVRFRAVSKVFQKSIRKGGKNNTKTWYMNVDSSGNLFLVTFKFVHYENVTIGGTKHVRRTWKNPRLPEKADNIQSGSITVAVRSNDIDSILPDLSEFILRQVDAVEMISIGQPKQINNSDLKDMKLQGVNLNKHNLTQINERDIKQRPGKCVTDYLLHELRGRGVPGCKKLTTKIIVDEMKELGIHPGQGYSVNDLFIWMDSRGLDVTVYALDAENKVFAKRKIQDSNHSLAFIVQDGHLFPLTNKSMVKSLAMTGQLLECQKCNWTIESHDELIQLRDGHDDLIKFHEGTLHERVTLITLEDDMSMLDIAKETMAATGCYVTNYNTRDGDILGYQHPTSGKIIMKDINYDKLQTAKYRMGEEYGQNLYNFKKPLTSFATCGKMCVELTEGRVSKSYYTKAHMDVIDTYNTKPICQTYVKNFEHNSDCLAVDKNKAYTSAILNNEYDYARFYLDSGKPYTGTEMLDCGEYLVDAFSAKGVQFPRMVWSAGVCKWMVTQGHLCQTKIKMEYKPSFKYSKDTFKSSVDKMRDMFDDASRTGDLCYKRPVNSMIGLFGKRFRTTDNVICCTTLESSMALLTTYIDRGYSVSLDEVGDLFFIRYSKRERILDGDTSSIWRHVVCNGIKLMMECVDHYSGTNSKVIAIKTDALYIENPTTFGVLDGWSELEDWKIPKYRPLNPRDEFDMDVVNPPTQWNTLDAETSATSYCCIGPGGSGKTTLMMKKQNPAKSIPIFSLTHAAIENVRSRGAIKGRVFGREFSSMDQPLNTYLENCTAEGEHPVIMVDEFSMVPMSIWKTLYTLKLKYPSMKLQLYGDQNQCLPVGNSFPRVIDGKTVPMFNKRGKTDFRLTRVYDYMSSDWFRWLVDYNLIELTWHENARYDKPLYKELQYLLEHGKLSDYWKTVKPIQCLQNIVVTNAFRKAQIAKHDKEFYIGQRLIAIDNLPKLRIYNSKFYTCTAVDNKNKCVLVDGQWVPQRLFTSGAYVTTQRYQGQTIEGDFMLNQLSRMDINSVYTALSRGTHLANVHIDKFTSKTFTRAKATCETWEVPLQQYTLGGLYSIENFTHIYFGKVDNHERMKSRWEEHVDNDKSPMSSSWTFEDLGEMAYFNTPELLKAEARLIIFDDASGKELLNKCHAKTRALYEQQECQEKTYLLENMFKISYASYDSKNTKKYVAKVYIGSSVVQKKTIKCKYGRENKALQKVDAWVKSMQTQNAIDFL